MIFFAIFGRVNPDAPKLPAEKTNSNGSTEAAAEASRAKPSYVAAMESYALPFVPFPQLLLLMVPRTVFGPAVVTASFAVSASVPVYPVARRGHVSVLQSCRVATQPLGRM